MKKILLIAFSLCLLTSVYAQKKADTSSQTKTYSFFNNPEETEYDDDDEGNGRGFTFGIDMGVYLASKKTANIYNGLNGSLLNDQARWFSVPDRFIEVGAGGPAQNIANISQVINDEFPAQYNGTVEGFFMDSQDFSTDMNYSPRLYFALNATYHFNDYWAVVARSSLANLKTTAVYTMTLLGPLPPQNASEVIQQFDINGEEQRLHLDLGFKNTSYNDYGFQWFWGGGMSLVGAKVESNTAFIGDRPYSLILTNNNNFQVPQDFNATQASYNFGFYATTGFEMEYQERYLFGIGFNLSRDPIELGTFQEDVWNKRIYITFGI